MPRSFIRRPGSTAILILAAITALVLAPSRAAAQTTFEVRVSANSDDAEQRSSDGWMYLGSSDLELAQDSTTTDLVGMRFTAVWVPQGATITNAYIQFKVDEVSTGSASLVICGEDTDDAATFTTAPHNLLSRPRTTALVAWSPPDWNTIGQAGVNQRTPDISSIIQEILDRPGWSAGNDLVIGIAGTGRRTAESHEGDNNGAPLLHIEHDGEPPEGTVYYVRPDGNDSNAGDGPTAGEAWQTVVEAVKKNVLQPGDVIYVMAGTHTGRIRPDEDGSSGNPVRVIADTTGSVSGWAAGEVTLNAPSGDKVLDLNNDDYWEFIGFTIQGTSSKQAVEVDDCAGVLLKNCVVYGGDEGIEVQDNTTLTIVNCVSRDNDRGIEMNDSGCTVEVWNSTIAHNDNDGVKQRYGNLTITNCIVAFNGDDGIDRDNGSTDHTYNLSYGNGDNNFEGISKHATELESGPVFADASARDYRLQSTSPAINSGTDAAGTVDDDLDGLPRPIGTGWDMGCYEYPLLGLWECDEGTGTDVLDSSGNGNDGTLQGGAGWVGARCGYAVEMDGSGDWVDLGQVELGTAAYTVGAWFKTSSNNQQTIFAATAAGTSDHLMLVDVGTDGRIRYLHRYPTGTTGGTEIHSSDAFDDGLWHFVTAVKDAATVTLYVDGMQVAQAADSTAVESSVDIVAGTSAKSGGSNDFEGSLDEIRLYGSALSPTEVSDLYGMVGYWKLDETSGTVAVDATVFGNDGEYQLGPLLGESGRIDNAVEFDGTNDRIEIPDQPYFSSHTTTGLTVAAWVKVLAVDTDAHGQTRQPIVAKGNSGQWEWALYCYDWGAAGFSLWQDSGSSYSEIGGGALPIGVWKHVAGTYEPGVANRLYVDGLEVSVGTTFSGNPCDGDRPVLIGAREDGQYLNAVIDDVRIYSRALCSDEIADLHGAGVFNAIRIIKWVEVSQP